MLSQLIARIFGRDSDVGFIAPPKARRRTQRPRGRGFVFEPLEGRLLLSVGLVGVPDWVDQGPESIVGANTGSVIGTTNPVTGAVQSIAVNPINAQQIFVGTVNGGIWRTNNADPANPGAVAWTALTDQQQSLAIGSIEFSPLDPTGNTLYAGTGSFSNLTWFGPPQTDIGILRTTDGGATWDNFAVNPANEGRIKAVLPTGVDVNAAAGVQEMILVAEIDGGAGLYRSNDNGQTFALLSGANGLPAGAVSQLIVDPNNAQRYYAAVPGQGVYRGDFNAGTGVITWTQVNGAGANVLGSVGTSANIQIAAHDDGAGNTTLYAGLANAVSGITGTLTGVFRSVDAGANWAALGAPAPFNAFALGGSGFSLVADGNPANTQVVYVSGLATNNDVARNDGVANTWTSIFGTGNALNNTQPHPDARDMAFIGNNILVEADDGGINFLQNPTNAVNNAWGSFVGDAANGNGLGVIEFTNIAWDSNSDVIIGGAQDNATSNQQLPGSLVYNNLHGGDGGDVIVDAFTLDAANQSIRYFSSQNLGIGFNSSFRRQVFDAANATVGAPVAVLPAAGLANFTAQFINPVEINAIAPTAAQITAGQSTRVVLGGAGTSPVYESNDAGTAAVPTWTAAVVPVAGPGVTTIATITSMAYGGRLAGADVPDVLYVGDNAGNVFVRSVAGAALALTGTLFPGGAVTDISLDPNDWRHAFVADATGIWETTNAGANWVARTGNLTAIQGVGAGNNNIQTVEFCELGAVDCLLVGGWGGVFRMITNAPNVWTEYGQFMPNAITYDLDFVVDDPDANAADGTGVLIAGTFGRGAWRIDNASSTLAVTGVLQIFGDEDFFGQDDTILLLREGSNPALLNVFLNGDFSQYQLSTIQQINVFGLGGNDTLIVDSSNGLINVGNGIRYDGDGGTDGLQLLQTGGPTHVSDTYSVGPDIGSGISTIQGTLAAGTQTVFFENLDPVLDLVPVALLTINATPEDNAIDYAGIAGIVPTAKVTIDEHESIQFANKTSVVIDAGSGQDTIGLNGAIAPAGLTGITVAGSAPPSGDTLVVTGSGAAVAVNTASGTITGAGAVTIDYGSIESLILLAGIGDLSVTTTAAGDTFVVTPGLTTGANSGTVESSGAVPQMTFTNSGTVTANLAGGSDALVVNGSASADSAVIGAAAVAITGRRTVNFTGAESLAVNGQAGSDTFNVTPAALLPIFIDGGDPIGTLPGDLLNIIAGGGAVTYNAGPETDEGSFDVGVNQQPVSFDHIESFGITGSGPVVINGTNGPDAITVIARDDSTHAAANGEQDFTVSVNTGPQLLFINVAALTVNALSGSDQVTLIAPAPNGAVWDVDVIVNGGPPAADTDRLIVQTPGTGADSAVYTPAGTAGGTLNLVSASSLLTIVDTEQLTYDGQGDGDTLSVVGTGFADSIVHSPGNNEQSGSFAVNSLLAIAYQNLGAAGVLVANGGGGSDTLVVYGTALNDSFGIAASGRVSLNGRPPIDTLDIATLTLEGLNGDDSFTLVPAISASVYTTMNLNGGGQSSAGGDKAFLVGTAGDDVISVSGQSVALGGKTVNGSGLEGIRLDALGGADQLIYNGVAGVTENITVSSSGVAGGGQVSVPNVTLVDFSGIEVIDVNGNTPSPTETDTLAFSGTNAVDIFRINLAAAGTDADPILQLRNSSAALLTLRNYTNFDTLRVNGLDGADTFNVYTADSAPVDRNVFIDGGAPTAKKKSTDNLNVFYVSPRPRIIHSAATQNPGSGLVDLAYTSRRFLVQYSDMEQVVIPRITSIPPIS